MDLHEEFKKVEGITRRTHTIKATMVYLNKNLHTIAPIIYRDERGYPEVSVRPHKGTLGQYVEAEKGYMNTEIDDTAEPFALSRIDHVGETVMVVLTGALKHRQENVPTEIIFAATPR